MTEVTVKRSVSLAIHSHAGRVLLVQRPPDDEDLPLAWGLPAASLGPGEEWEVAVRRAARDKLGLEVQAGRVLEGGELERPGYHLEMRLYEARPVAGEPAVPQPVGGVTQYVGWRWGDPEELAPAAAAGSLCSRLYLSWNRGGGTPSATTRHGRS
jgi:ADP-ribose pyrophosphatase YjhB (NUDIX family)